MSKSSLLHKSYKKIRASTIKGAFPKLSAAYLHPTTVVLRSPDMSLDIYYNIRHDGENMLCCLPGEMDWKPAVWHDNIREELIESVKSNVGSYGMLY